MKFTKQQVFEILRSHLTNGGKKTLRMSEKSINAQLDTLIALVANDEMEIGDFVDKVKPTFDTMNSNVEKDNSDFIKKWKEEHPDPTPDPNQKPNPNQNVPPVQDPAMKALLDRLEALEKENKANKEQNAISQKRTDLIAKMKEKGINDDGWIESFLGEVSISADTDIEAKAESFLKLYNKSNALVPQNTTTPHSSGTPTGNPAIDAIKALSEQRKKAREAAEALASKNQV